MSATTASASNPLPPPHALRPPCRIAVVGVGGRAGAFIRPLATRFRDSSPLVGMCDSNPARLAYYNEQLAGPLGYQAVPTFAAEDFAQMIRVTRPDVVLICTVDSVHHEYIIQALELGCDVITEKPLTTRAEHCRAIFAAAQRTGRRVHVAFNARWQPRSQLVKRLLSEGIIGEVLQVNMEYMLNTRHGADYFRRWHREKDKSGGLMVHKSTHHFDLVNWWLDAVPETVFGLGRLAFYGRENARRRGIEVTGERYRGQDLSADPFAFDIEVDEATRRLYADAEQHDGYVRDRQVFSEDITIEDSMSVLVKYRTGAILNYSLNAYLPREGCHVVFNGTGGRMEFHVEHPAHVVPGVGPEPAGPEAHWQTECIVQPLFGKAYHIPVPVVTETHGGGDSRLLEQLFAADPPADELDGMAGHGQGAASALIGIAANEAFDSELPVRIADRCPALGNAIRLSELP